MKNLMGIIRACVVVFVSLNLSVSVVIQAPKPEAAMVFPKGEGNACAQTIGKDSQLYPS